MSKDIEERVVKMKFDNAEFERKTKDTMSTLEKLKTALKFDKGDEGFRKVDEASRKLNFSPMGKALDTVTNKFSIMEIAGVTAVANLANSAVEASKRMTKALTVEPVKEGYDEYELKMGSVQTIMASTGAKLSEVNGYLAELNTYSDKTIYSFSDMTNSIGKFTNAGVNLKDAVAAIQGISNEAAVSGANAEQASHAMYNFAQALSAGYVKLIDWKSIENANMATVEFKSELLKTAEQLGTVEKQADGMYKVLGTNANGSTMKETINATKNFNDSLAYQWMTTDVLTKTLARYADETTEIGKKAFASAQDIKTFSMLMDTLKEAVGSGWAETFEIIIGDFEEAKQLWTVVGNTLGGIIDKVSTARNNMLRDTLDRSTWDDLKTYIKGAGVSAKELKEELLAVNNVSWEHVKKQYGSMDAAFAKGNLFKANDISKALDRMVEKRKKVVYSSMSDAAAQQTGYTAAQIAGLRNLQNQAKQTGSELNRIYETIDRPKSGRELLIEAFGHAFGELGKMLNSVGKAWDEVFGKFDGAPVFKAIEAFNSYVMGLNFSDESADKLRRTFKGLFSILDIVTTIFGGAFTKAIKLVGHLLGLVDVDVLSVTASLGDMATKFRDWLLVSGPAAQAFDSMVEAVGPAASSFKDWTVEVYNSERTQKILSGISDTVKYFGSVIHKYFKMAVDSGKELMDTYNGFSSLTDVKAFFTDIGDAVKNFKFDNVGDGVQLLEAKIFAPFKKAQTDTIPAFDGVGDAFTNLKDKLETFAGYIKGTFSKIDLGAIVTIAFGAATFKTLNKMIDVVDKFSKPFEALAGVMTSVKGALAGVQTFFNAKAFQAKADAYYDLAKAVAVLAGSLFLVSKIPSDKLLEATLAIGGLILTLTFAAAAMSAISSSLDPKKMFSIGFSMIALGGAVALLVNSLKILTELSYDTKTLWQAIGALTATMLLMVGALFALSKIPAKKIEISAGAIIGISASLGIMVKAIAKLAKVTSDKNFNLMPLVLTLGAMVGALAALTAVAGAAGPSSAAGGFGVLAISAGLFIMVEAIKRISTISDKDIARGMAVIVGLSMIYSRLMIFSMFSSKNAASVGTGILAMSSALIVIAVGIRMIAGIKNSDIEKGLAVVVKCFALFAGIMALSKLSGKNAARAGLMILEMSGAMILIAASIMMLSMIDDNALKSATNAVSQIMVIFGILLGVSRFAGADKGVKSTIIALTMSLAVLSISLGALSMIDPSKLQNATLALTSVMGMLALLTFVSKYAEKSSKGILAIGAVLTLTAGALYILSSVEDPSGMLQIAASLSAILLSISVALAVASMFDKDALKATKSILTMTAALAGIALVFEIMQTLNINPSMETALALSTVMLAMSVALIAVSAAGKLGIAAAAEGTAGLMIFVTGMAVLLAALGNLNELMGDAIQNGIPLLIEIADGLGAALGSFVSALVGNALSFIPQVGQDLSDFATNAQPFFDQLKSIDSGMVSGAAALAAVIVAMGAGTVLDSIGGLMSVFTGTKVDIAGQLQELGTGLRKFADETAGIEVSDVKTAAEAAKALIETISKIPRSDGLLQDFIGGKDADKFGDSLEGFGEGIQEFSVALNNTNWDNIAAATDGSITKLVEMCAEIPNAGGKLAGLLGDNDPDKFGNSLEGFGEGIQEFSSALDGTNWENIKQASSGGVKKLVEMCKNIPNAGGAVAEFFGENTPDQFGDSLVGLGKGVNKYSEKLSGTKWNVIESANKYLPKLFKMVKEVQSFYFGENDFANLGQNLSDFADQIQKYSSKLAEVDKDAINVGTEVMKGLSSGMTKESGGVGTAMAKALSNSLKKIRNVHDDFNKAGKTLMSKMAAGIKADEKILYSIQSALNKTLSAIREYYGRFESTGEYFGSGFVKGVRSKISDAEKAGKALGSATDKGARKVGVVKSPSRVMKKVGGYFGEGFVIGVASWADKAAKAGANVGDMAISALSEAMSGLDSNIADMDYNPVITPVLDLSNIQNGASSISGLLNSQAIGVNGTLSAVSNMDSRAFLPDNGDVINAINGLSGKLDDLGNTTYNVNGITYDDGSNVTDAISSLVHAVRIERRI